MLHITMSIISTPEHLNKALIDRRIKERWSKVKSKWFQGKSPSPKSSPGCPFSSRPISPENKEQYQWSCLHIGVFPWASRLSVSIRGVHTQCRSIRKGFKWVDAVLRMFACAHIYFTRLCWYLCNLLFILPISISGPICPERPKRQNS